MAKWYEHAIIYQIYPKSFQDSNHDGIGDLNGIRQRIPYLKSLGINTVWLNPVFVSPQVDNGYDVSNYFAIDELMGNMADMEKLIADLHDNGIRIVMDFVMNHTSDQHPWFQDAISSPDSIYRDYYIFAGENGQRPNNWGSFFGGSVWEPDPAGTGQSYFHLFDKHMPDLNWHNPEVRHAMLEIAEFWLAKGIDGLRIDAFIHIAKADLRQDYPTPDNNDDVVVAEPFFANLPQVQTWMREFCQQIKEDYPDALLLGEAASANVNLAVDYTAPNRHLMDSVITFRYFTESQDGVDPSFNDQYQPKKLDLANFKLTQAIWQQTLNGISLPTLYWNNHDMARLRTRYATCDEQAKSLAMLMYLQRGLPVIYYGEELGLQDLHFDQLQELGDPTVAAFAKSAAQAGKSEAEIATMVSQTHKLAARGTMPWTEEAGHGFSDHEPWIKGKLVEDTSVAKQEGDANSFLSFYRQLLELKQTPLFEDGAYYLLPTDQRTFVYQRDLADRSAIVAVNMSGETVEIALPESYGKTLLQVGAVNTNENKIQLAPYAGVVLAK